MRKFDGPTDASAEDQQVTLQSLSTIPGDNTYLQGGVVEQPAELTPVADSTPAPTWLMHPEGRENRYSLESLGAQTAVNAWLYAAPAPTDATQPAAKAMVSATKGLDEAWVWTIVDDVNTDQPNAVLVISQDGRYLRGAPIDTTVDLVANLDTTFHNTSWQLGPVLVGSEGPPPPHEGKHRTGAGPT